MPPEAPVAPQRVGIFGGAFDPPHLAHLALARAAMAQLNLDELRILPTGRAWHKSRSLSQPEHRLAMCRLAFGDLNGVVVDDRELRRDAATYTIDTLEELRLEQPQAQFFLLVGQDQLQAFTSWRRWTDVLDLAALVVAERPDTADQPASGNQSTSGQIPFLRLEMPKLPVSSTLIRARLAAPPQDPGGWTALVPVAVASYISQHSLYQQPT